MTEFELIAAFTQRLGQSTAGPAVLLGPGDDCALVRVPAGEVLATSVDSLVAGVHFPADAAGDLVAGRALCVSVSDLAAMGAEPLACTLALTLPLRAEPGRAAWALALADGLAVAAARLGLAVVGGNMADGPVNLGLTVFGSCPEGQALVRSAAAAGDRVYLSGVLGLAALGLEQVLAGSGAAPASGTAPDPAWQRYWWPEPRLALGLALRGLATAAIDVSDGLLADAGHLALASGVRLQLQAAALPLPAGCPAVLPDAGLSPLCSAGDDYELLFTAPAALHDQIMALATAEVPLTWIGQVVGLPPDQAEPAGQAQALQVFDHQGATLPLPGRAGYQHFGTAP